MLTEVRFLDMGWKHFHNLATLICMEDFQRTSIEQACDSSWLRIWLKMQAILQDFEIPSALCPLDLLIDSSPPMASIYCLDITPQALIKLSVYPANNVCPSALHAKLTHSGSLLFLPTAVYSGFNSSTLLFFSRSKMMMELDVAAHSQYRFGEKTKAWISSPAVRE